MSEAIKALVHLLSVEIQTPVLGSYYSRVSTDGGAKAHSSSAVRKEEDGTLRIELDFSLRVSTGSRSLRQDWLRDMTKNKKKDGSIMLPFFKLSMRFKVPSFKPNRNDY